MRYVLDEKTAVLRICGTFLLIPAGGPEGLSPTVYRVNESAYILLERMREPCSLEELVRASSKEFDRDMAQISSDTEKMLEALLEKGFIRQVP
jgi:hypothetical protein